MQRASLARVRHVSTPEHVVPADELDQHELSDNCSCEPFVYTRLRSADDVLGTEVRHNSFEALPVDEEALEEMQAERLRD